MIAPRTPTDPSSARPSRLGEAHRLIAAALLKPAREPADDRPAMAAWKAWLVTAWAVLAVGVYFLAMIGRL